MTQRIRRMGPPLDRLRSRLVETPGPLDTPCQVCTYRPGSHGYAVIRVGERTVLAHRFIYEQEVGPIPPGLELDHLCCNKICCNTLHLDPVTHRVNSCRGPSAHMIAHRNDVCLKGHSLADAIRNGKTGRRCRVCRDEWRQRRRDAC